MLPSCTTVQFHAVSFLLMTLGRYSSSTESVRSIPFGSVRGLYSEPMKANNYHCIDFGRTHVVHAYALTASNALALTFSHHRA